MMCTVEGDSFYTFTKNMWIGDTGASCNITNDDNGMFDIEQFVESVQRSSRNMTTMRKSTICMTVQQVKWLSLCVPSRNEQEWVQIYSL